MLFGILVQPNTYRLQIDIARLEILCPKLHRCKLWNAERIKSHYGLVHFNVVSEIPRPEQETAIYATHPTREDVIMSGSKQTMSQILDGMASSFPKTPYRIKLIIGIVHAVVGMERRERRMTGTYLCRQRAKVEAQILMDRIERGIPTQYGEKIDDRRTGIGWKKSAFPRRINRLEKGEQRLTTK